MASKIPPKSPQNNGLKGPSPDEVPQYGPEGANSPDSFHNYMNEGSTQGVDGVGSTQSPMELMAQQQNANFGAPKTEQPTAPGQAAPENFGPPGITQTTQGEQSSFGAPQFQQPQNQEVKGTSKPSKSNPSQPFQVGAPINTNAASGAGGSTGSNGSNNNLTAKQKKKKHSYKEVENMETNAMMQNAISHMKVKDPDPKAWE